MAQLTNDKLGFRELTVDDVDRLYDNIAYGVDDSDLPPDFNRRPEGWPDSMPKMRHGILRDMVWLFGDFSWRAGRK